jgi:hypothetical protein
MNSNDMDGGWPPSGRIWCFCESTHSVWLTMILVGSGVCLFVVVRSFFVSQHNSVWLIMILIGSVVCLLSGVAFTNQFKFSSFFGF